MPDSTTETLTLARRFFAAIESGDVATIASIYAPGAVVWHNHDGIAQPVDENLATLGAFIAASRERRYEVSRLAAFEGGFVQQHVLTAVSNKGASFELPACVVCKVECGRITRLDEYFDSAQVQTLIAGLAGEKGA
ncbi:MAG TPA: nuclear transport factor 2 family protein [Candidatus Binatia bacterium]|nr:nuclear transport factor 2 family protein [Candidatus Binatia bacterium]